MDKKKSMECILRNFPNYEYFFVNFPNQTYYQHTGTLHSICLRRSGKETGWEFLQPISSWREYTWSLMKELLSRRGQIKTKSTSVTFVILTLIKRRETGQRGSNGKTCLRGLRRPQNVVCVQDVIYSTAGCLRPAHCVTK